MVNHHLSFLLALLLSCLITLASSSEVVYELTLLARNDQNGTCQALAEELGNEAQASFNEAVPGFTPYQEEEEPPFGGGERLLRESSLRSLQVRLCSRTYCSKRRNWQWCLWNGCSCSCGQRRRALVAETADDAAKIVQAKQAVDILLAVRGAELGCELGLVLEKVRG